MYCLIRTVGADHQSHQTRDSIIPSVKNFSILNDEDVELNSTEQGDKLQGIEIKRFKISQQKVIREFDRKMESTIRRVKLHNANKKLIFSCSGLIYRTFQRPRIIKCLAVGSYKIHFWKKN